MTLRPEYLTYRHDGQDEYALCFAATAARRILIVPPLFDEMNRVRRMLVPSTRPAAERDVRPVRRPDDGPQPRRGLCRLCQDPGV